MPEELVLDEAEVDPVVGGPSPYGRVIVFDESEVDVIRATPPGYRYVVASEPEPVLVDREPAYEIVFADSEVEPLVFPRPYEVVFDDTEVTPIGHEASESYEETLAPARTVDFDPVVITGVRPRTGPIPVRHTAGLTAAHRRLLGKQVIEADPIERWGVRQAGRAVVERTLSPAGTSAFLADYKDRWVRAHRHVITAAANQFDLPSWVLAGVAWTEVAGDPEVQDEVAVFGLRPERVSFGQVQMELRRAAEELGYDPLAMTAVQRRVLIWSLLDPQQNLFLVAAHLDRLRDLDAPARPATELTDEDIRVLGARYNRGPELSLERIRTTGRKTAYGDDLLRKRARVERLLE